MSGEQYKVEMPDGGSLVLQISDSNTYSISSTALQIHLYQNDANIVASRFF